MAEPSEPDLDSVIERLLEGSPLFHLQTKCISNLALVRGSRPGKQVQLAEYEIRFLCTKAREIFINQPILLELEAPLKICGTLPNIQPPNPKCSDSNYACRRYSRTVLRFTASV